MSLCVFVDDPAADPDDIAAKFIEPAGFEDFRRLLWGAEAVRRRAPMLARITQNLEVAPAEFDEFERQSSILADRAEEIAAELGWSSSERIKAYADTFLSAVAFARAKGSELIYVG